MMKKSYKNKHNSLLLKQIKHMNRMKME